MHASPLQRLIITSLTLACGGTASAQTRIGPLVDVAWLADHINDPNTVLIHVGPDTLYENGHLPGARFRRWGMLESPMSRTALPLEMPTPEALRADLSALGVTDAARVVVIFDRGWVTPATRVLVTLQYAGLGDRAALLDGGQAAWVAAGHALTTVVPPPGTASVAVHPNPALVADFAAVQSAGRGGTTRIIDARAPVYYSGPAHGDHPAGHIPSAHSLPFTSIVDDTNKLKSVAELTALFREAGVAPGESVIVYCHVGQQATLVFTAATLLGIPVRLYDGSFEDWARRKLPVEGGTP